MYGWRGTREVEALASKRERRHSRCCHCAYLHSEHKGCCPQRLGDRNDLDLLACWGAYEQNTES